jgi:hypothetical protein
MKKLPILPALAATALSVGLLCQPAIAQTLKEKIEIVRKRALEKKNQARTSPQIAILQTLLYRQLDVHFAGTPAQEVFDYLATVLGHGIDPKTPITLEAEDMLAMEVLEIVLGQCSVIEEATWQLRDSSLEVGTKERLSAQSSQQLRVYPIGEMLFEAPRFENAPPMGFQYGYPGWIGGYDGDAYYTGGLRYGNGYLGGFGGGYGGGYGGAGGSVTSGSIGTVVQPVAGDVNSAEEKKQRALDLMDLITEIVEPDAWTANGGTWATIRYVDDMFVVRAPDFVHRQIGGYPPIPRPAPSATPAPPAPSNPPAGGGP